MVIDDLYYGDNCSCCTGHFHNEATHSFAINSEVLQEYLRTIYKGFDTSDAIEPTMWRAVLKVLYEATVEGLSRSNTDTHDHKFLASLRHSNEVFAAFKVHSMGEKMAEKLLWYGFYVGNFIS